MKIMGTGVSRNASAMIFEREALRMGIEHLTVLFPTGSSFDFQVENSGRTVQYKLNAQSLRLFGVHSDVNDVHRAGANRLQNKQDRTKVEQNPRSLTQDGTHNPLGRRMDFPHGDERVTECLHACVHESARV